MKHCWSYFCVREPNWWTLPRTPKVQNPPRLWKSLSLLRWFVPVVCDCVYLCVHVCKCVSDPDGKRRVWTWHETGKRSTKSEWQRDGDKTFWRREEGPSLWSVCFLKEEEQNHRSRTKRKRESEWERERESEGDGVKRGERWEQIVIPADGGGGGGYRSGCKCWRRRGKLGKRENWENRGRRTRVGEKGGIWGISKWKEKVFLLMRLKFSISLHLLQTVGLWEQHPSRVWDRVCVCFCGFDSVNLMALTMISVGRDRKVFEQWVKCTFLPLQNSEFNIS